ncbi:MAG: hypothetical protein AAF517_14510 [Planctomycetota bacterium]
MAKKRKPRRRIVSFLFFSTVIVAVVLVAMNWQTIVERYRLHQLSGKWHLKAVSIESPLSSRELLWALLKAPALRQNAVSGEVDVDSRGVVSYGAKPDLRVASPELGLLRIATGAESGGEFDFQYELSGGEVVLVHKDTKFRFAPGPRPSGVPVPSILLMQAAHENVDRL